MDFDFYGLVRYRDRAGGDEPPKIGRWLGIAHEVGSPLCYWILKKNGQVIPRSTVQPLTADLMQEHREEINEFNDVIKEKYGEFDSKAITVFDLDDMEDPITNGKDDDEDESETEKED